MPPFSAIALDRLLETGASKPIDKPVPTSMPVPISRTLDRTASAPAMKKKVPPRPPLKPALYTTPEVKLLPIADSPSSFPPSPYVVNHKRRGPRLLKSSSEASALSKQNSEAIDDKSFDTVIGSSGGDLQFTFSNHEPVEEEHVNGVCGGEFVRGNEGQLVNGHQEPENCSLANGPALNSERDTDIEDFFDPRDSMSFTSNTDVEENAGTDLPVKFSSPVGEFYDACEELSSVSATQNFAYDVEAELHEMRLSLLMEIEKRKQAEESLNNMRSQWESIKQGLSLAGIVLPAGLSTVAEDEPVNSDPLEDLCQQLYVARFISNTIGRATVRAEVEMEMEAQLESKNFDIARILERLHCYETMNREMSQRNQEAVEMARRERQRKRRRKKWIWGSITTVIVLGTAAIALSYLPVDRALSSAEDHLVLEHDDTAK
ncbi:hypothetical protein RYX36_003799 [Vicia faba]